MIESNGSATTEQWLRHWLSVCAQSQKPSTMEKKEWAVFNWLIPMFGKTPLTKLTPEQIERTLRRPTDLNGQRGTASTRIEVLRAFKTALQLATVRGRISTNPAATVTFAAPDEKEIKPFTRDELTKLLDVAQRQPNSARWLLALALGLRQSEALGLQWGDIDFEAGTLKIVRQWNRKKSSHGCPDPAACIGKKSSKCPQRIANPRVTTPKTKGSKRTIVLMPKALDALSSHRVAQMEARLKAGRWEEGDWVFTNHLGKPIEHRRDLEDFKKLCMAAGLGDHRVHDLRHAAASHALIAGIPDRLVQELMGWTSARMAQRYQHVFDEARRVAAAAMNAQLFG